MDDLRLGALFRAVRIRRRLRQIDVADQAGLSRSSVSRLERGDLGQLSVSAVRAVAACLEIRLEHSARWRGGDLDRLVSGRHARLAEIASAWLRDLGWVTRPEVSFAIWGERGVVDLLCWLPAQRALLVVELKTEIVDVGELLGTLDRKRRLARAIGMDLGWDAASVGTCLLVAEGRTNRRRIEAHRTTFGSVFPDDARRLRTWLKMPAGPVSALRFVSDDRPGSVRTAMSTPRRVVGGTSQARAVDLNGR